MFFYFSMLIWTIGETFFDKIFAQTLSFFFINISINDVVNFNFPLSYECKLNWVKKWAERNWSRFRLFWNWFGEAVHLLIDKMYTIYVVWITLKRSDQLNIEWIWNSPFPCSNMFVDQPEMQPFYSEHWATKNNKVHWWGAEQRFKFFDRNYKKLL